MKNFKLSEKRMLFGLIGLLFVVSFVHTAGILNLTSGVKSQTAQVVKTASPSVKITSKTDFSNKVEIDAFDSESKNRLEKSLGGENDNCLVFRPINSFLDVFNSYFPHVQGDSVLHRYDINYNVTNNCGYPVALLNIQDGTDRHTSVFISGSNFAEAYNHILSPEEMLALGISNYSPAGGYIDASSFDENIQNITNMGVEHEGPIFQARVIPPGYTAKLRYERVFSVPITYNGVLGIMMIKIEWTNAENLTDFTVSNDEIMASQIQLFNSDNSFPFYVTSLKRMDT